MLPQSSFPTEKARQPDARGTPKKLPGSLFS